MSQKLNDINYQLLQGGSGRVANGSDFIAGLMAFNDNLPSAFPSQYDSGSGGVAQLFSLQDAVAFGINNSYSDETASKGTVKITNAGSIGDTIDVFVTEWTGGSGKGKVSLTGGPIASDSFITHLALAIKDAINTNTKTHGYTATLPTNNDTITITARPGIGVYLNTGTPYTRTIIGGITTTIVQNTVVGVYSKLAVLYYHIQRYFVKKPDGYVYVGLFPTANATGASAFSDIDNMMAASNNKLVQMGIWDDTQTFALSSLTKIQTRLDLLRTQNKYLSNVKYAADVKALAPIATLAGSPYDLSTLTDKNVSAVIDGDGNGVGWDLFKSTGKTISSLGACVGCSSAAAISEDYGNTDPNGKFNCNDGAEFDKLILGDGSNYDDIPKSELDALNANRYVFLSKVPYTVGSFYSDDHVAVALTSDFAYEHDSKIIDRVIKDSWPVVVPILKARLSLNTDGTMTAATIATIIANLGEVIKPLIATQDLAGDADNFDASQWILVSPTQKPNVTGKLIIGIKLAENGIAHSITIPIGFGTF